MSGTGICTGTGTGLRLGKQDIMGSAPLRQRNESTPKGRFIRNIHDSNVGVSQGKPYHRRPQIWVRRQYES